MPKTEAELMYELLEFAYKMGYNWRGVWNRLTYTAQMHNCESIVKDTDGASVLLDKEFQRAVFGAELTEFWDAEQKVDGEVSVNRAVSIWKGRLAETGFSNSEAQMTAR
jgi:hypothetical protein